MRNLRLTAFVLICLYLPLSAASIENAETGRVSVIKSTSRCITLDFNLDDLQLQNVVQQDKSGSSFNVTSEGMTYEYGKPILPAVSRFVVVPPSAGLELIVHPGEVKRLESAESPLICVEGDSSDTAGQGEADNGIYPPVIAEMSTPIVVRGVRLVTVTTYPVQYNSETKTFLVRNHIQTEIRFNDSEPVNPAKHPYRRNRSREFLEFIDALAINGSDANRDDPDADAVPEYTGHYLVVAHENCVSYIGEFIEWRRKSGWKVDILSLPSNISTSQPAQVQELVQDRYDEYLEEGVDPFDNVLLIGDRSDYGYAERGPQWILHAPAGYSIFNHPAHADYLYGCLEGDDDFPDVAISRWCAGDAQTLGLFAGRTLSYEANPYMEDTDWYTKGVAFSNHWGNGPDIGTWHISIQSNVRWGVEVLEYLGFDDIRFHEDFEWRGRPDNVLGVFERDLHNEGVNLLIGRTRNHYWWRNYQGVNDNVIFPIRLLMSGHSEWPTWNMLRTGDANHLKGPVAATCGWGNPQTIGMTVTWLEMVNGMLLKDLSLGWMRLYVLLGPMQYIPRFYEGFNRHIKADFDVYGDPGIRYWKGVPRVLRLDHPETVTTQTRMVDVHVFEPEDEIDQPGVQVTLYAPGDMPDPDERDYVDYDEMFMMTRKTDDNGIARFIFDKETDIEPGTMFVTATGRDVLPLFGEMEITRSQAALEIADYQLEKIEGEDNDQVNPGDVLALSITARNLGDQQIDDITAMVSSQSPWIEIADNLISFGDLDGGEGIEGDTTATISISPACPDGSSRPATKPEIIIDFRSGDRFWSSGIKLDPSSPNLVVTRVVGGNVIGTEAEEIDIEIENTGSMDSPELTAEIIAVNRGVDVTQGVARYPSCACGANQRIRGELFSVMGNAIAVPGSVHQMLLVLSSEGGFIDTAYFSIQVGITRENTPLGPDAYGYICFDDTDDGWDYAPVFDWIEISPNEDDHDFDGERLAFDGDSPHNIGEALVMPLGFISQFYGYEYDTITVSTNGFISIGNQPLSVNFQNWPLDRGIGGGVGMIAPFWDDLRMTEDSGVFWYYDDEQHVFIIEWYKMRPRYGENAELTFEVIIRDREFWGTPTGDPDILMLYNRISNTDGNADWRFTLPYASVGISSPDGNSGISYTFNNEYPVQAAPLEDQRAILFSSAFTNPERAVIRGQVTDAANNLPLPDARVYASMGLSTFTDENGFWEIDDAFTNMEFCVTARLQGYNDSTLYGYWLEEDDTLEIDFALLHPEFAPSSLLLETMLEPGDQAEIDFRLENTGNGPLSWMVERKLPGNADTDPWEFRESYAVGDTTDDTRIFGLVFFDSLFYVTGDNDRNPTIYILNKDGVLLDTLAQPGEEANGMRDIAYDGELIWAASHNIVYGIRPDGEVVSSFESPYNPTTNITWDPDRECLWLCTTTTDPLAYTRDGEPFENLELSRHQMRIYGLAYWEDDPDDSPLYIFHKHRETNLPTIHKMNIENGDTTFVAELVHQDGGSPGGAFITNNFDVYSWVFLNIMNSPPVDGGDRIDIWQVEGRMDWFSFEFVSDTGRFEAKSGVINPEDFTDFILVFDATDLPMVMYAAEIHFWHNAAGGHSVMNGILDVIGPMPPSAFHLVEPADGDTLGTFRVDFKWESSFDLNAGENVTYDFNAALGADSWKVSLRDTMLTVNLDTAWAGSDFDQPIEWWVTALSGEDTTECVSRFTFTIETSIADGKNPAQPFAFALNSIYPNPFNSSVSISFEIDETSYTTLSLYNISGREATRLFDDTCPPGAFTVNWKGDNLASGVYFVRLESLGRAINNKVIILK